MKKYFLIYMNTGADNTDKLGMTGKPSDMESIIEEIRNDLNFWHEDIESVIEEFLERVKEEWKERAMVFEHDSRTHYYKIIEEYK